MLQKGGGVCFGFFFFLSGEEERGLVCFRFACLLDSSVVISFLPFPNCSEAVVFPFFPFGLSFWLSLAEHCCWRKENTESPFHFTEPSLATALPGAALSLPALAWAAADTSRGRAAPQAVALTARWRCGEKRRRHPEPRGRSGASGKGVRANTRASRVPISGCLCPLPHAVCVLGLLRNSLCYFSHLHLMLVFFARRIAALPPGAVWDQRAVHSGVLWTVFEGGFSMENHVVGRWSSPLKLMGWKEWLCSTPALVTDR